MARSPNGQAISAGRRARPERRRLQALLRKAAKRGDLKTWRRVKAVLGYLAGKTVITMAEELSVTRGSINRWLQWFETTIKMTTHNKFHRTTQQRDGALRRTFTKFQRRPALIAAHVARFQ